MAAPTTNLDRTQSVTLANPTPPTNVPVNYQGTPPTPRGLAPAQAPAPDAVQLWLFADPLNGAVATQWSGTDALPVTAELAGKAEADGTEVTTTIGNSTGHSVLGGFSENPNPDHPSGGDLLPAAAAPVLDLVTDASDNTPDFTLTGDLVLGDTVRFQYSTNPGFGGASELTNTIDAAEDAANSITFTTGALAINTWYFRARIERPGHASSDWSNVETITLSSVSPEAAQFLARTSGLNATHTNAYTALIDGLVADGIWAKLDALYIFATQDVTTAKLNLKTSSYSCTSVGTQSFIADQGIQSPTYGHYLNTGLNAFPGDKNYKQNSAHMSCWVYAEVTDSTGVVGTVSTSPYPRQYLMPNYANGNTAHYRLNTNNGLSGSIPGVAGFALANRSDASSIQGYHNNVQTVSGADTSVALVDANFSFPDQLTGDQNARCSGGSFGSSLTSTEATNFYTRWRAYMTAVGAP